MPENLMKIDAMLFFTVRISVSRLFPSEVKTLVAYFVILDTTLLSIPYSSLQTRV